MNGPPRNILIRLLNELPSIMIFFRSTGTNEAHSLDIAVQKILEQVTLKIARGNGSLTRIGFTALLHADGTGTKPRNKIMTGQRESKERLGLLLLLLLLSSTTTPPCSSSADKTFSAASHSQNPRLSDTHQEQKQ